MTFIFPNLFSRVLKYFKILITQTMPARAKWYFLTKIKHLSVNSLLWCSFLKGIRENKSWTYAMWLLRHLHCKQRLKHTAYMVDREDSLNGGHMGMSLSCFCTTSSEEDELTRDVTKVWQNQICLDHFTILYAGTGSNRGVSFTYN